MPTNYILEAEYNHYDSYNMHEIDAIAWLNKT
jgi:hypothetical protein